MSTKASPVPAQPVETIDASCRWPLFALFSGAGLWLVTGSVLGLLAAIKFHSPDFLAEPAWLTYGRLRPAAVNLLAYGFSLPGALALALWLMSRLGHTQASGPVPVVFGALLWNLGVAGGLCSILTGNGTGFEYLEFSPAAAALVFSGYLLIGGAVGVTFVRRRERVLFAGQWLVLAAIFWFPWIHSTGVLLTGVAPVRGVAQAIVAWWYAANLTFVWQSLAGLGIAFYLLPRLTGRALESHYLVLFIFWTLLLFGPWTGIPGTAPVPAWMVVLSRVAGLLTVTTLLGAFLVLHRTLGGRYGLLRQEPSLPFVGFGLLCFVGFGLLGAVEAWTGGTLQLQFTWFASGRSLLGHVGFLAMILFGGAYHVLSRLTEEGLACPKLVRVHFWLVAVGVLLGALPLVAGGFAQAARLADPQVAFVDVAKSTLMFLRIASLGDALILIGNLLFLVNVLATVRAHVCSRAKVMKSEWTAETRLNWGKS